MSHELAQLIVAEKKASELFKEIETRGIIHAGKTENEINKDSKVPDQVLFGLIEINFGPLNILPNI